MRGGWARSLGTACSTAHSKCLADPQPCVNPISSPWTQPPAGSKQSVLFLVPSAGVSWICTGFVPSCQEGSSRSSFLGLRNAPLLAPILHFTSSQKPCHPCSPETPTRTGTRDPFLPLGTTHLRKPSSHWSPSFLGLRGTPTLYLLQGSHPHLRHRVLGTPLTSAVRDVPTEESLLLSLVQQRWVFKQQERRDQIPSQGREKAKRRGGRHPRSPPSGPLHPTSLRRWQRLRRRRLLEVARPQPAPSAQRTCSCGLTTQAHPDLGAGATKGLRYAGALRQGAFGVQLNVCSTPKWF